MAKNLTIGSLKSGYSLNQSTAKKQIVNRGPTTMETNEHIEVYQHESLFRIVREPSKSVLEAGLNQNVDLDYKCRQGTCGR